MPLGDMEGGNGRALLGCATCQSALASDVRLPPRIHRHRLPGEDHPRCAIAIHPYLLEALKAMPPAPSSGFKHDRRQRHSASVGENQQRQAAAGSSTRNRPGLENHKHPADGRSSRFRSVVISASNLYERRPRFPPPSSSGGKPPKLLGIERGPQAHQHLGSSAAAADENRSLDPLDLGVICWSGCTRATTCGAAATFGAAIACMLMSGPLLAGFTPKPSTHYYDREIRRDQRAHRRFPSGRSSLEQVRCRSGLLLLSGLPGGGPRTLGRGHAPRLLLAYIALADPLSLHHSARHR